MQRFWEVRMAIAPVCVSQPEMLADVCIILLQVRWGTGTSKPSSSSCPTGCTPAAATDSTIDGAIDN